MKAMTANQLKVPFAENPRKVALLEELSRPPAWWGAHEPLRPVMEELESRLPGILKVSGGEDIRLYRNVSRSDLGRVGSPWSHPWAKSVWPLMYLVCRGPAVLFGFRLEELAGRSPELLGTGSVSEAVRGIPYVTWIVGTKEYFVESAMERVLGGICREVKKRKEKKSCWVCYTAPVPFQTEGAALVERGLTLREGSESLRPTERGELCGLLTLFTSGQDGRTKRTVYWSPDTRRALAGDEDTGPVSLSVREERLERGFASSGGSAAAAVRRLAEMPLSAYFRACPELNRYDLQKLRVSLGLPEDCMFRTAAAALYRRMAGARTARELQRLVPLAWLLARPVAEMPEDWNKTMLQQFREGNFIP